MVDQITVPTYKQIEVLLTKLAEDYSELASSLYDVFFNPEPMDVTMQLHNKAGVLQSYTIPNRAKDFEHIMNGNGTPEGVVLADKGDIYQDLEGGFLYIKETDDGTTGWSKFATEDFLKTLLIANVGSPEGNVVAARGALYVDTVNAGLYIKTTLTGKTGWLLISASTSLLANIDLSNLSTTGQSILDAKEVKANKTNSITANSTADQYPSAQATYSFVTGQVADLANKSLSNLNEDGEAHFANPSLSNLSNTGNLKFVDWKKYVKSGILSAPNGLVEKVGNDGPYTVPQGMVVLYAFGLNDQGSQTLEGEIEYLDVAIDGGVQGVEAGDEGYIFVIRGYDAEHPDEPQSRWSYAYTKENIFILDSSEDLPVSGFSNQMCYVPSTNTYYHWVDTSNDWSPLPTVAVGEFKVNSVTTVGEVVSVDWDLRPYYPIRLATERDTEHVVSEIGGSDSCWFRLYKNGWVEQGGYITGGGTIAFEKEFKNTNYTFVPSANATSFTKSTDSVTVVASSSSQETDWLASGWAL